MKFVWHLQRNKKKCQIEKCLFLNLFQYVQFLGKEDDGSFRCWHVKKNLKAKHVWLPNCFLLLCFFRICFQNVQFIRRNISKIFLWNPCLIDSFFKFLRYYVFAIYSTVVCKKLHKMAIFRRAGMREGVLPLPLAFQYLILVMGRACDLNLVMISSLASE